jgi:hypothetical protein
MKALLLLSIISIISCCDRETTNLNLDCFVMEQNSNFKTEDLNQDYTIQFPPAFQGEGLIIDEFVSFNKSSSTGIKFNYTFLSAIDKQLYFGVKLAKPVPNSYDIPSQSLTDYLQFKKEFCIDDKIVGILYYSQNEENSASNGKLFLEHNQWYYEALNVTLTKNNQIDEIIDIFKTIKKK